VSADFSPIGNLVFGQLMERLARRIAGSFEKTAPSAARGPLTAHGFAAYIEEAARRYGVPQELVNSVVKVESNFRPDAVSSAGAKGLMQLMDGTARTLGVRDAFDPRQNIDGGVRLLRDLLSRYDDVGLALAAYNAGPGAVDKHGGIPPIAETQAYVRRVMSLYEKATR